MFGFEEDAALANSGVDKEIEIGKITDFLLVLYEEIRHDWIVTVGVVFREVVEGYSGLQIERFGEEVIGKIECVAGNNFRHV